MNKSKFKCVKFKPFDMELHYWNQQYWISYLCSGGDSNNSVRFTDSFIESYPEFFEVEKAGSEFEHKAYYKVKISSDCEYFEPAQYNGHTKGFYVINSKEKYLQSQIFEIGEKIEL